MFLHRGDVNLAAYLSKHIDYQSINVEYRTILSLESHTHKHEHIGDDGINTLTSMDHQSSDASLRSLRPRHRLGQVSLSS